MFRPFEWKYHSLRRPEKGLKRGFSFLFSQKDHSVGSCGFPASGVVLCFADDGEEVSDVKTVTLVVGVVLGAIVLAAVFSVISAAVLMVALALVHRDVPEVPALGFAACFGALLAITLVAGAIRSAGARK